LGDVLNPQDKKKEKEEEKRKSKKRRRKKKKKGNAANNYLVTSLVKCSVVLQWCFLSRPLSHWYFY
jgi:hypothetical protein